jgi:MFS family permease
LEDRLPRDGWLLFLSRFVRLFAYGALSVVLVFYLASLSLNSSQTGILLSLILAGDTVISLFLTTRADRMGRRRTLIAGALLMCGAGIVFAFTKQFWLLVLAGTIGVVSPSGGEVGPFLSIEQAALTQVISSRIRTHMLAWYTLAGSFATAAGSLCGGLLPQFYQRTWGTATEGYRAVVICYAIVGAALALLFGRLSQTTEATANRDTPLGSRSFFGLGQSRGVVLRLSALFALDSFGGGFVLQSFAAYWFYLRFGVEPAALGAIFFGANIFAGISALLASRIASRIGLIKTMVYTHLPSNVLLILIPLMPTLPLAIAVLLLRFSISQMDVPTRQSYVMGVVRPEERSAAAGVTGVARTIGASIAPFFVGLMFARPSWINVPFLLAGALKIAYDLLLYKAFIALRPPEEALSPTLPITPEAARRETSN